MRQAYRAPSFINREETHGRRAYPFESPERDDEGGQGGARHERPPRALGRIARIAKSSGHDFIFIDGQHAVFTLETIAHIAHTALGCGITPIVRVRSVDDQDVQVLLDNGVMGIVYPDVNTAAEARRAVARAKFPPIGKRSAAGGYPMFDYRAGARGQTVSALNDATLVVCMIETPEGVKNVEEIAKVDGVDVIHIGANDLLTAMGKPGAFGDPEGAKAIDRVISVTPRTAKSPAWAATATSRARWSTSARARASSRPTARSRSSWPKRRA